MIVHRYASHYLHVPDQGYLRMQIVEVVDGYVRAVTPFEGNEVAHVEWCPGVIMLEWDARHEGYIPFACYPFDFTAMQVVGETQRRRLR